MADQAEKLRTLFGNRKSSPNLNRKEPARIITVASGKGGVGKTSLTVNLAIALSQAGKRVMIMDADLGMANVDIMLGVTPRYTIYDFLSGQKSFPEIIIQGLDAISLIPGCSGIFEATDLRPLQKEALIKELNHYAQEMDFVLIDAGAGISKAVLGFMAMADEVVIVMTPEPTSITDGYAMIKILSKHKLHRQVHLIINSASSLQEAQESACKIEVATQKYLNIKINRLGVIYFDNKVRQSIKEMTPFIINYPRSQAARDITNIANNILENKNAFHQKANNNFAQRLRNLLK